MKKFEKILLFSDMDGTLLNSQTIVSKENQKAIQYFIEEGGLFGIATGRSQLNSVLFLDEIKVNAPCILYNGSVVYDFTGNEFIAVKELSKDKLKSFLNMCLKEFSDVDIQIYSPQMCYFISPEDRADPEFVATHQPCVFCHMEDIEEEPWIKILFRGEKERLELLNAHRKSYELENEISWVFSSDIYLEYLPYGVSKGSALQTMIERFYQDYKVYAVGDYYNDIEMLKAADVGIATRNAIPALKENADVITVSNDDNAVADIIFNIIK